MKKTQVHNKIWLLIVATITLVVFLFVSIIYFGSKYQEDIKKYTVKTIENHVIEQNLYFDSLIKIQFDELTNISKFIDVENIEASLPSINFTENVNDNEDFVKFIITDINGQGMMNDKTAINISSNPSFKNCINGDRVIINSSEISNEAQNDEIILMIPIYVNEVIVGTIGAYYKTDHLSKVLMRETAEENEFFCVVSDDGKIIFSNNTESAFYLSNDFNNILQKITFNDFTQTDVAYKTSGALTNEYFTSNGEKYYITQVATGYTGWNLVHVINAATVDFSDYFTNSNMFYLMLTIILAFFIFLIYSARLVFSYKKDVETEKQAMLRNQTELELMHERYQILARYSDVVVYELDLVNKLIYANENYENFFGVKPVFTDNLRSSNLYKEDISKFQNMLDKLNNRHEAVIDQIRFEKADKTVIWCQLVLAAIYDKNEQMIRLLGRITNIDKMKRETEIMKMKSQIDSMTSLYNSETIKELIIQFLSNDNTNGIHALMIIDIDDFKSINDRYGHKQGDFVLRCIANNIKSIYRSTDLVGRLGGDEFMIFLTNIKNTKHLDKIAANTVNKIANTKFSDETIQAISCSVGAVLIRNTAISFNILYYQADVALYYAKRHGKNQHHLYKRGMEKEFENNPDLK